MGKASKSSGGSKEKQDATEATNTTGNNNSDIQSWSEVPSIAHFCSLFRQAFDLLEFDIQELEESLLLMGTEDDTSQLVLRLLIKLLKGCSRTFTNNINEDNYNTYLRRLFLSKREEAEEDEIRNTIGFECKALLDDDIDFPDLSLRNRVRILQQLTEYRLDADDVFEKVKNLEASSLRVDPLGKDSDNVVYWYFYGTRLYKDESQNKNHPNFKTPARKAFKYSSNINENQTNLFWSVACLTLQDWEELAIKYQNSKKRCDKELFEIISVYFLPDIRKMYAQKERLEKRKLLMMGPRRNSSRLEKKRENNNQGNIEMEEERRLEEEYDEKVRMERQKREEEEREAAREERVKQREAMKELRAKRAAEREFSTDAIAQRHKEKTSLANKRAARVQDREKKLYSDLYNPFTGGEDSDEESKDLTYKPTQGELRDTEQEESKDHQLNKEKKPSIINALLKVGTKSIKDVSLDKPVRKSPGLLLESAGRSLLQRRSVPGDSDNSTSNGVKQGGLSFGLCSAKISFGLYGGHLDIGQSGQSASGSDSDPSVPSKNESHSEKQTTNKVSTNYTIKNGSNQTYSHSKTTNEVSGPTKSLSFTTLSNKSYNSSTAKISVTSPLSKFGQLSGTKIVIGNANPNEDTQNTQSSPQKQKAFSNWGGEFFKKNLDYRANTNKILEKMNLTNTLPSQHHSSNTISNSTISIHKKETPLSPTSSNGENFKTMFTPSMNRKRPLDISPNQNSNIQKNESPAKQLKPAGAPSIYNSYNM